MRKKKSMNITNYINKGIYFIMRKCPNAHTMLGCSTIWDLSSTQFKWLIENISEELAPDKKK